ncbi:glycoside hydrolase/phage tail family protein [Actibacterium sp. XHP0104]|uniref:baseplate multidomain protein megatron n=1 Tax=Actibacterium sp. XHP0104 TaxID=2984335 RepID=UPI0021E6E9BA|nr:glycoside hydrolase/phage tail family protein [Actibacterium sp. XHP0104]MCV2880988.1 glycoside hydrolase/phage tail family protein [Actibacterium sp. XHP0104]
MATIVLSAAGAAVGSAIGGSVLGLSSVVIGRAIGATIGQYLDQTLLGAGSAPVETGRMNRFRLSGASEGRAVGQLYGRNRLGGQVIWASRFRETRKTSGGGKSSGPEVTRYSYSVSLAIAICEGEIQRLGRIWADGVEIAKDDLTIRLYHGTEDQMPDPKIEAVEGAGMVPSYRGIAYVVIEDLQLGRFGNRVPHFSFEVVRSLPSDDIDRAALSDVVPGVALIPGSGEYALAVTPVYYGGRPGDAASANINSPSGKSDFETSLETLNEEVPACGSTLLVASWFGDDLRAGHCTVRPKVNQTAVDAAPMRWRVSGLNRAGAEVVPEQDSKPVYGGTPADHSIVEAITALKASGKAVTFYPFMLMDQVAGNMLPDPYSDAVGQAVLPWRGRITTQWAPGVPGSTDGTVAAEAEVAAFFGSAQPGDFSVNLDPAYTALTEVPQGLPLPPALIGGNSTVSYSGPAEWSYRRFILHYAHLCAAVGGVEAFCIGSEMRGLTRIRGAAGGFPAVQALRDLAADVRGILGPEVKIGYAADWSEYFGYHPQDGSGDLLFHLDPLWADPNIDFIGIDNYMPLSDWRDGDDHADADWGSIYNLDYLRANIEGGEGYDWYYPSQAAAAVQRREPITDGAYDEAWVYRYKDIRNWWLNPHHERLGGVRQAVPTDWVPQSKPIWFTEFGCAAIDKGTNQPNKFLDPKSSESALPAWSTGMRDDFLQQQYLRAMVGYWVDPAINPVSDVYGGPMVDVGRSNVWAWDVRPYPHFPTNTALWGDGANYHRGHWLNGRVSAQTLAAVVAEICARSGVVEVETGQLYGLVRGYAIEDVQDARASLQPLMLAHGFDAVERGGRLVFQSRGAGSDIHVMPEDLAVTADMQGDIEMIRAPEAETAGRVRLNFVEAEGDFEARAVEAILPDEETRAVSVSELPLVLTRSEGRAIAERWLAEARVARDRTRFALPPSRMSVGAGDVVGVETAVGNSLYRIDRVEQSGVMLVEAVRCEPAVYLPSDAVETPVSLSPFSVPVPVLPLFLDLPLITGSEVEHAPHLAVAATPWPGRVALFGSAQDADYQLNTMLDSPAMIGVTETPLFRAASSEWDRGPALRVRMSAGAELGSVDVNSVLNGANRVVIGDGSAANWEVFQFAEAQLVAEDTYELRMRLRGQAGTEGVMPDAWPVGSYVVVLDSASVQIGLSAAERGLARHYRVGPAGRSYEDPSYSHLVEAFDGIGLRPYAPCHLRARRVSGGDLTVGWVRRTRVDGDSWASFEVPLGEAQELYQIRVRDGADAIAREAYVTAPIWTYTAAEQAVDGVSAPFAIEVAQISDRFGAGLFERIEINE